jgi:hypothetical protein
MDNTPMAMAPPYERARLLSVAIDVTNTELQAPIDRIEVVSGQILVSAGNKHLTLNYHYSGSYDLSGVPIPGGGNWVVEKAESLHTAKPRDLLSRLRNVFARSA